MHAPDSRVRRGEILRGGVVLLFAGVVLCIVAVLSAAAGPMSYERCFESRSPAGVATPPEGALIYHDFGFLPMGLHCGWRLQDGSVVDVPNDTWGADWVFGVGALLALTGAAASTGAGLSLRATNRRLIRRQ